MTTQFGFGPDQETSRGIRKERNDLSVLCTTTSPFGRAHNTSTAFLVELNAIRVSFKQFIFFLYLIPQKNLLRILARIQFQTNHTVMTLLSSSYVLYFSSTLLSLLFACCTHPQIPGVRRGSRHSIRWSSRQPNCVIIWDNNHETRAYQYSNAQTRIRAVRRKHKRVRSFLPLWWPSRYLSTVCYCVFKLYLTSVMDPSSFRCMHYFTILILGITIW